MKRAIVFIYGLLCYAAFFVTFLYTIGFVNNLLVPRSMDGPPIAPFAGSAAIDLALLLVFAVQHSVMARPAFKQWMTRAIPEAAERSTYVLASSLALTALFSFWHPLGGSVWTVRQPAVAWGLFALSNAGFLIVLVSSFLINHFDLFGLRQVWLFLRGKPYQSLPFKTPGMYRHVRHPLYVGFLLAFWCAPSMTVTHLLFAVATTTYILIAIQFEERDLVASLGDSYREYREHVPMLVPAVRAHAPQGNSTHA